MSSCEDLNYWINRWQPKDHNDDAITSFWDTRAKSYNQKVVDPDTSPKDVLDFLKKEDVLTGESVVLDIGCGPGRYALAMARDCKEVVALDISKEMIEYLGIHVKELNLNNIHPYRKSWEEIDLVQHGWDKKFDLVFASMTPGVYNFPTLNKMLEASKGYCYLSGFIHRKNDLWDKIENDILGKNYRENLQENKIYYAFNILWNLGYQPQIMYQEKNWQHQWTLEEVIDLYIQRFKIRSTLEEKDQERIKEYLSKNAQKGKVIEKTEAKTAALLWKVK